MAKSKKSSLGRRRFLKGAAAGAATFVANPQGGQAQHGQEHDHDHDHQAVPSDLTLRVKALESLLVEKGLVDRAALDAIVDTYEHKVGAHFGARVVGCGIQAASPDRCGCCDCGAWLGGPAGSKLARCRKHTKSPQRG